MGRCVAAPDHGALSSARVRPLRRLLRVRQQADVEPRPSGPGYFYGTLDLELARHPRQTILAYEMNDEPLPVPHGAPVRLRVETQLGFKMVKYIRAIGLSRIIARSGKAWAVGARTTSITARRQGSDRPALALAQHRVSAPSGA